MNQPDRTPDPARPLRDDPARLSLLGHDLRAAVSDIIGGLRLIDQSGFDDATRVQLERVRAAGEVLARLFEEALAVMTGEDGEDPGLPANIQMRRFLYDAEMRWSGRAREKGLGFALTVAPEVPQVVSLDRIALERVLANILSNAVKHTDRGRVGLEVRLDAEGALRFAVRDEGPGFSQAALDRLFEYEGRPEGAAKPGHGLGMHISKHMTGRLGGTIAVRNLPEGGAEVVLTLPADRWTPAAPEAETPLPDLSRVKVLLAEDSPANQAIAGHMLAAMGAEFEVAEDGVEALHWLEREDFDLALIDIEMPRLSGLDVIRTLRANERLHRDMPIIAVTAYVLRANRDAIYAAGADAILAKPVAGIETFGQAIVAALGRVRADPAELSPAAAEAAEMNRATFEHLIGIAGDSARELIDRLLTDLRRAERGLVAGVAEADRAAVRAETHVLISLAGAVGAEKLQALASALNDAGHRGDDAAIRSLGQEALALLDRLIHTVAGEQAQRGDRP